MSCEHRRRERWSSTCCRSSSDSACGCRHCSRDRPRSSCHPRQELRAEYHLSHHYTL